MEAIQTTSTSQKANTNNRRKLDTKKRISDFENCLIPLLDSLGWRGEPTMLMAAKPHLIDNMDLGDFAEIMANLKFESHQNQSDLRQLDHRLLPCLFVSEKSGAKVLIKKIKDDEVLTYNGWDKRYTQQRISKKEKGTIIFFSAMKSDQTALLSSQTDWFQKMFARFRKVLALAFTISLFLSIFAIASPFFVMTIYDRILAADSQNTLMAFMVGIAIFISGNFVFRLYKDNINAFVSVRLGNIVGNEVLRRIMYLPPSFTETASLGSQVSRVKDFESIRDFFAGPAFSAILELPFVALLIGAMILIGREIAYIPLVAMVLFIILGLIFQPLIKKANGHASKANSEKQEFIIEILTRYKTIKKSGATKIWMERFNTISADSAMSNFRSTKVTGMMSVISQTLMSAAGLATMAVGVIKVIDGSMSAGALMACMMLVWKILAPMKAGFSIFTQLNKIIKSIAQLNRLMALKLEDQLESGMSISREIEGKIKFNQVSLKYSPQAYPALIGVNFQIEKGQIVAIIGHDGAGKSTILKLILGLYLPQVGDVVIDEMNVKQTDPIILRQTISYAPQKARFFYGTIAQNLRFSKPDATDKELEEVSNIVGILDQIKALPNGFETRFNKTALYRMSSNFLQGINLSRVLLRKSKLLLFDEPEKNLLLAQKHRLSKYLKGKRGFASVVMATHDPDFINIADQVIWLEKGRIRQSGLKEQVMENYLKSHIKT